MDGFHLRGLFPEVDGFDEVGGEKDFEQAIHARIAMKHRGVADDLVGLVVYLASDASHYVTGQVIAHDGGWDGVVS